MTIKFSLAPGAKNSRLPIIKPAPIFSLCHSSSMETLVSRQERSDGLLEGDIWGTRSRDHWDVSVAVSPVSQSVDIIMTR
jgi:hypothetical protein